ncbi:MAG: hypothetical protein WCP81_07995 [Actinomycetes bacterium]
MTARVLSPNEVREILTELVKRLAVRGSAGAIHVIGGAAIALINPDRVATQDVDGFIRIADAQDVLDELARDYGLTPDWFNWRAQGLQPPIGGPEMWHEVVREGSVVLQVANTDALLAMKLNAARARDTADIAWLLGALKITDFEVAERIFEEYYPGDALKPVAQERLKFALESNAQTADELRRPELVRALREVDDYYRGQPAPASEAIAEMYPPEEH